MIVETIPIKGHPTETIDDSSKQKDQDDAYVVAIELQKNTHVYTFSRTSKHRSTMHMQKQVTSTAYEHI